MWREWFIFRKIDEYWYKRAKRAEDSLVEIRLWATSRDGSAETDQQNLMIIEGIVDEAIGKEG